MKKLYDVTWRGYYVMSVVLGVLMALSIEMALEVAVLDAIIASPSESVSDMFDFVWGYLPMNLDGGKWQGIMMALSSVLTVILFVKIVTGKAWRTKVFQAVAVAFFDLLLQLTFAYVTRGWITHRVLALFPVLLMVVPLVILVKLQQKVETLSDKNGSVSVDLAVDAAIIRVRGFLHENWYLYLIAAVVVFFVAYCVIRA